MTFHCKDFCIIGKYTVLLHRITLTLISIIVSFLLYSCSPPKKIETYKPIKDKTEILENSSSLSGIGPIPEWVLEIETSKEIQKSKDGVFFVFFTESNNITEINPQEKFLEYLSSYLPDANVLVKFLKLEKSGKYWQKVKNGNYQIFFKYEITKDSINEALKNKNQFSEKTKNLLDKLVN